VVDATGHDAWVAKSLEKRGLLKLQTYGRMDVNSSEDLVVEKTGEVFPGLYATGMAVSTIFGIPRMGPTFAGMLFSGRKAAELIKVKLAPKNQPKRKEMAVA
ncbi:MAG: ribose 1,5-bisphosphate isomerase, partial [Candidatus Omnitrophica bacterium]|nr:ribose 1,5-bisphosphate isomerase [Candidatus Omnitrophota bacterium]